MDQINLDKIASFEEALKMYEVDKSITVEEFSQVIQKFGKKVNFWNAMKDPNPAYVDNEKSRVGFKWNPYHNEKGKYYQSVIKKVMLSTIDIVHSHTLKKYDNNQFIYDDPRIIELDSFAKAYIGMNFKDSPGYKDTFMYKLVDIIHGTIAKEDIYYRCIYFDFINKLIVAYPKGFPLTETEKLFIQKWHKGQK